MTPLALEVDAKLVLEDETGVLLRLDAQGDVVRLQLPGRRAALRLARQVRLGSGPRRRLLAGVAGHLAQAGIRVEVRIGAQLVARTASHAHAGLASRLAALDGLQLRPLRLLRALLWR